MSSHLQNLLAGFLAAAVASVASGADTTPIQILPSKIPAQREMRIMSAPHIAIPEIVRGSVDLSHFRNARVQVVYNAQQQLDHLLVHLHSKTTHRVDFAAVHLDQDWNVVSVENNYKPNDDDNSQQPGTTGAVCPDPSIEFIAFAPNNDGLEQQITKDVAAAARARGLKTVELLKADATRDNYLNYMACPNLKGNFYDGDANPNEFATVDGMITAGDMAQQKFNYHVTNIWLACEAYNDPMLSNVTKDAKSQKFAAGMNDLLVGPSDRTGKCAMIAAINGKPMTQAFNDCYKKYDTSEDHWGFGGDGADFFGQ